MHKHFPVAAAIFAATFAAATFAAAAHAEFRFGGQIGFAESEIALSGADEKPSGALLGGYAQLRHTLDSGLTIGLHYAAGEDSTEVKTTTDGSDTTTTKLNDTRDSMAIIGFYGDAYDPVILFGRSAVDVENIGGGGDMSGKETLSGWKFAFGIDFDVSRYWAGHVLLHYADYGAEKVGGNDTDITQTGIRLGLGFRF